MSKPIAQRILARIAAQSGFDLLRKAPIDLRGKVSDPLEAIYRSGLQTCVIEVPISHCRSSLGFSYGNGAHPYAAAMREYRQGGAKGYVGSKLEAQHRSFQPASVGECLNLDLETGQSWKNAPPHGRVLPWEKTGATLKRERTEQRMIKDNIQRGAKLDVSAGRGLIGPVTIEKGELEYRTLVHLMESVEKKGFLRNDGPDGDVYAIGLAAADGQVRFLVRKGTHRINVLDALEHETLPLRFTPARMVRVAEAAHWPHVRDGMFRLDEAIEIFNRLFDGIPFQLGKTS